MIRSWPTFLLGFVVAVSATCTRAQDDFSGECPASPKTCGDRCVAIDDPSFGCTAEGCSPCVLPHATATCEAESCAVGQCAGLQGDCDGIAENGCEVDLAGDVSNCGACGLTCSGHAAVTCVQGECQVQTCDSGFGDCDENGQNGCETAISSTAENCGACGRDCDGGACEAGRCEAVVLFEGDVTHQPMGIAVDDEHIYWANFTGGGSGRIYRLPKSTVGAGPDHPELKIIVDNQVTPFGVAVDDDEIFWTAWGGGSGTDQGLFRGPKTGVTTPVALPGAFTAPSGVARQGSMLYWTNFGNFGNLPEAEGIWRLDLSVDPLQPEIFHVGCAGCALITDVAPTAGLVYWPLFLGSGGGGAIQAKQFPIEAATLTRELEDFPRFVATDEASVYWTTNSEAGGVRRADLALSGVEEVLSGLNFPTGIAVDDASVFVGELNSYRLLRVAKPR